MSFVVPAVGAAAATAASVAVSPAIVVAGTTAGIVGTVAAIVFVVGRYNAAEQPSVSDFEKLVKAIVDTFDGVAHWSFDKTLRIGTFLDNATISDDDVVRAIESTANVKHADIAFAIIGMLGSARLFDLISKHLPDKILCGELESVVNRPGIDKATYFLRQIRYLRSFVGDEGFARDNFVSFFQVDNALFVLWERVRMPTATAQQCTDFLWDAGIELVQKM